VSRGEVLHARTFPVIFAAPSGAGKTSIAKRLRERRNELVFSVSATTRAPRPYEKDGEHYHFVDEPEFRRMAEEGELLEWAEVHGNLYGTPRRNLEEALAAGQYLILDIDVQGSRQVRRSLPEAISIFVLPPSGPALAERLAGRGSEDTATRNRRLANACGELASVWEFDYAVVNDDIETAVRQIEEILRVESMRVLRSDNLAGYVEGMCEDIREILSRPAP
jgi:guanylate kinase